MRTGYSLLFLIAIITSIAGAPPPQSDDCQGGSVPSPCVPDTNDADAVVGVSEIMVPYSSSVASYSATELGADVWAYYDAYVEGYLYQGGTLVDEGAMQGGEIADGYLNTSYQVANTTYQILSYHYLVAVYCENEGVTCYSPMSFTQNGGGSGWAQYSGTDQEWNLYLPGPYVYLGSTSWSVNTALPQINAVYNAGTTTPASVTVGTQNAALEIHGQHLTAGGDDPDPVVSISGSVTLLSVTAVNDGQINVSYDATNATAGLQSIAVTTYAGVSNPNMSCQNSAICLNIGDPTPVVGSITPSQWAAGQQYGCTIQIQGTGFGTNPTLTIASGDGGSEIASYSICGQPTDSLITASVTTNTSFVQGSVNVTVQSNGYNGSGFVQAQHGESGSATATVTVTPEQMPVPQIWFNSTNVAGTTALNPVPVLVGQEIALTIKWPTGVSPTAQSWTDPSGGIPTNIVGGYNGYATSNQLVTLPGAGQCQILSDPTGCLTFYFVWAGTSGQTTQQLLYRYTFPGGSDFSPVTFAINGPTAQSLQATFGTAQIISGTGMTFGNAAGTTGVNFTAQATLPTIPSPGQYGSYQYIQMVTGDQRTQLPYDNSSFTASNPQICNPGTLGLDNIYPFAYGNPPTFPLPSTQDSPGTAIPAGVAEKLRDFSATMYLMWDPGLPTGCQPAHTTVTTNRVPTSTSSTCASIPVPLANLQWEFKACAINTLVANGGVNLDGSNNGTAWSMSCSQARGGPGPVYGTAFQSAAPTYSYPQWSSTFTNGQAYNDQTGGVCP